MEISTSRKGVEQKTGELWSTNNGDFVANGYSLQVNTAHSEYADAFEFGSHDFARRGI